MRTCRLFRLAILLVLTALPAGARGKDLVLIEQGRPAAVIVVPAKGPAAGLAMQAAQVLAEHLQLMSGAKLDIRPESLMAPVSSQGAPLVPIFVGESALAQQAGFTAEGLGSGGILVQTSDHALALLGPVLPSDPRANLYAVISFLEDLGCRYLWPGETGRIIPRRATVTVAPISRRYTPPIAERGLRWYGLTDRVENGLKRLGLDRDTFNPAFAQATAGVAGVTWLNWQKSGGALGISGGHAGCGLRGGWKEWGEQHPEWFALQADGTRDQSRAGDRFRVCVSNPGLIEHVANDVIQRFNEKPNLICVSLSPNDGGTASFCLCPECKKLDPPEAPKVKLDIFKKVGEGERGTIEYPALTDRYVWYWNQIAQRVTKVHPNALLLGDAYSVYGTPPVREKVHPNMIIRYVPITLEGWDGWRQAGTRHIYWRPNILLMGRRDGMLLAQPSELARIMRHMADNGMLATDFDSIIHNWAVHGLNYYVTARLTWDPKLSADQILADYAKHGFGPAAEPIQRYWQRVEQMRYWQRGPQDAMEEKRFFTPENLAELRSHLAAADQAAAGDEAILARIAFLRLGLNYTDLHNTLDQLSDEADGKSASEQAALKAKAAPLLDLHFLVLRDFVKNHMMALNTSYLMWVTNEFTSWAPIGGRMYRPSPEVLALGDTHSQSGRENSLTELLASFALDKSAQPAGKVEKAAPAGGKPGDLKTRIDADEEGRPVRVLE